MLSEVISSCLLIASNNYQIPSDILQSIMIAEGGKIGQVRHNTNGSYDMGIMQINSLWLPELAKHWNVREIDAAYALINDPCSNINVAAWILKQKMQETNGDLFKGIGHYHSKTPKYRNAYVNRVYKILKKTKYR